MASDPDAAGDEVTELMLAERAPGSPLRRGWPCHLWAGRLGMLFL
jgi:hypothetical protein